MRSEAAIEQLAAIRCPDRLRSAARRIRGNADLLAGTRVRLHVDLAPARLVGGVRDPPPIGRELRVREEEARLQEQLWSRGRAVDRQDPDARGLESGPLQEREHPGR